MNDIQELVERELNSQDLDSLESLGEWWIEHEYTENEWESEKEYNDRKRLVIPLIVKAKLLKYEEEYI